MVLPKTPVMKVLWSVLISPLKYRGHQWQQICLIYVSWSKTCVHTASQRNSNFPLYSCCGPCNLFTFILKLNVISQKLSWFSLIKCSFLMYQPSNFPFFFYFFWLDFFGLVFFFVVVIVCLSSGRFLAGRRVVKEWSFILAFLNMNI